MIRLATFVENEPRTFSPVSSMSAAVRMVRDGDADGLCIGYEDAEQASSYEVVPGRSLVEWHGYECWFK